MIPDGRVSLCCHDYSLKYFKGDLKSTKLKKIYQNGDIFDKNNDFVNGNYYLVLIVNFIDPYEKNLLYNCFEVGLWNPKKLNFSH